jgi:hypothetical protein
MPKQIAARSIRQSRWSQPRGPLEARSTGGSKSAGNGWVAYGVRTVGTDGSKRLIFGGQVRVDSGDAPKVFVATT